jgi:hypothetical protein
MANLNNELQGLLNHYIKDGFVDTEKILKDPEEWKILYENYKNPNSEKPYDNLKDIKIEEVNPYFLRYNIKRFWFKDAASKITVGDNEIVAFQDGVKVILKPGDYINGGEVGYVEDITKEKYKEFVYLYLPQKIQKPSDNFYLHTHGDYLLRNYYQPIIRFYFSLDPAKLKEIRSFIQLIRNYFNDRKIPFQLKTPYTLDNFNRADTLVLYIAQNHYFYTREFIKKLRDIGNRDGVLRNKLPLFVKVLSKKTILEEEYVNGIGFAEDPFFTEDSFGQQRCKLIIDTIKEISKSDSTVSIQSIIDYLNTNEGYSIDEFYRNPYTNFDYCFEYFDSNSNIQLSSTWHLQYLTIFKYRFLEVARDYALELMERAVWLNEDDFTWISYSVEENKKGIYQMLDEQEKREIIWALDRVLKVKGNREYFPDNVIKIIENKLNLFENDPDFKTKMKGWSSKIVKKYSALQEKMLNLPFSEKINKLMKWKDLSLIEKEKNIYEGVISFLQSFDDNDIDPAIFHALNTGDFQNNDMVSIASKIRKKYTNINYPIPNKFGNYEYSPTSDGKLKILMIMLYVAYPNLFDEYDSMES